MNENTFHLVLGFGIVAIFFLIIGISIGDSTARSEIYKELYKAQIEQQKG